MGVLSQAKDLLFVQIPLLKKTGHDYCSVVTRQKQIIEHCRDSICEFERSGYLYMEDIDCQENRFQTIYLMLKKRLEWSIKKAIHLEKVACREEAKLYGGNLPFVRRMRKQRHAAMTIQQAWR